MKILSKRKGISFVEVMVTIVILVSGFTGVYQAYLKSLNYLEHVTTRLYLHFFLDHKISLIQKELITTGNMPDHLLRTLDEVEIAHKVKVVEFSSEIRKVDYVANLFKGVFKVTWIDNDRRVNMYRQAYLRK